MIISLIIVILLLVAAVIAAINLLIKNEKQEEILAGYFVYLDEISNIIKISDKKLNDLDTKGTFKSDDEIGYFFDAVKDIQKVLNKFKIN